jgi:hypothetical protein
MPEGDAEERDGAQQPCPRHRHGHHFADHLINCRTYSRVIDQSCLGTGDSQSIIYIQIPDNGFVRVEGSRK